MAGTKTSASAPPYRVEKMGGLEFCTVKPVVREGRVLWSRRVNTFPAETSRVIVSAERVVGTDPGDLACGGKGASVA